MTLSGLSSRGAEPRTGRVVEVVEPVVEDEVDVVVDVASGTTSAQPQIKIAEKQAARAKLKLIIFT